MALATAAGVAIENARLYEETRRRADLARATSEITTSLLSGSERRRAAGSSPPGTRDGRRRRRHDPAAQASFDRSLRATSGAGTPPRGHANVPVERLVAGVVVEPGRWSSPTSLPTPCARRLARVRLAQPRTRGRRAAAVRRAGGRRAGPGVEPGAGRGLPLPGPALPPVSRGRRRGAAGRRAREDRQRLAMLEDRDRIGRDLHDVVIQRLFAVGLGLQGSCAVDRPSRRRRPPRAGGRRPRRDHQGHSPVDLRAGQHRRVRTTSRRRSRGSSTVPRAR